MNEKDLLGRAKRVDELTRKGFRIGFGAAGQSDVYTQFEWRLYQAELHQDPELGKATFLNYARRVKEVGKLLEKHDDGEQLSEREMKIMEQFARDAGTIE